MFDINEMLQERAKVYDQMKVIQDKYNDKPMEGEEKDTYGNLETKFDDLTARIENAKKQQERDRLMGEKPLGEAKPVTDDMAGVFSNHLRTGDAETLKVYNALRQTDPTQAGYLVAPEKFVNDLIAELNNNIFFRNLCKKYTLQGAQTLGFPKRTARMNSAAWGAEIGAPTPDSTLAFGKRVFTPNFLTAEILVSRTLIANAPDVDGIVRSEIAYDIGELLENAYMTGDGSNKPLGIFTASDDGIPTSRDVATDNTASAVTFDGLMNAKYSVKQQYQPKLAWIFHRDVVKQIAKIKDSEGQYIWQPSVVANTPDILLGKPVYQSEYAPNTMSANAYVGMLGDFSNYWICDGMNMELRVLQELYARTDQIDYIAHMSTDGMPVLEECFARIKLAASQN